MIKLIFFLNISEPNPSRLLPEEPEKCDWQSECPHWHSSALSWKTSGRKEEASHYEPQSVGSGEQLERE